MWTGLCIGGVITNDWNPIHIFGLNCFLLCLLFGADDGADAWMVSVVNIE